MPSSAPTRSPLRLLAWLALLAAAVLVGWYALSGRAALGSAPVTEAAGSASPASSSAPAVPSAEPGGASTTSASHPAPRTDDPEAQRLLDGRPAPWSDITAAPVHVDLRRGDEHLVGADVKLTQKDADGDIDPEPRSVGWYGPPQWSTTPGERSDHPGILAGHVVYYGVKDVFWRLDEAVEGDLVVLTYDDGTRAAFRVSRAATSVEKSALTHDPQYEWAWSLDQPGHVVTLITCDLDPGTGMVGNAKNNWVVQAVRVA